MLWDKHIEIGPGYIRKGTNFEGSFEAIITHLDYIHSFNDVPFYRSDDEKAVDPHEDCTEDVDVPPAEEHGDLREYNVETSGENDQRQ